MSYESGEPVERAEDSPNSQSSNDGGQTSVTADIHCVKRWSKLDTVWRGVSLDTLLADIETEADFALVHSFGGYSTSLPLEDLIDGQAWVAYEYEGEELAPEHGGPARLLVPHLYFLEVGQVGSRHRLDAARLPRLLGATWLPRPRRPVARAAIPG
jgi:DMSO/TMAO reductase YedYZ molybdopterin-dependent catalytic subunit